MAYTLITSQVLASAVNSITFSSIPSTYKDLAVRVSARDTDTGRSGIKMLVNGSTGTVYSATNLRGNGAAATTNYYANAASFSFLQADTSSNTANTFGSMEVYLPNYTSSTFKPISAFGTQEDNSASTNTWIVPNAMLFNDSTSITSITFSSSVGINFVIGSSFYLYGIN
jgi:hypothetical protein